MKTLKNLLADTRHTLEELLSLIENPALDVDFFGRVAGPHTRHVLDHYDALLATLSGARETVDYDSRARDTRTENDRHFAALRTRKIMLGLEQLGQRRASELLQVLCSTTPDRCAEPVGSTLGRELQFLQSHCIHHLATISARAESAGIRLHPELGKAPATIAQERSLDAS